MSSSPIVTPDWLNHHLEDSDLTVVDCRFELGDPEAGRKAYQNDHIPGAVYMDLEKDLSGKTRKHGGRHPLPDMNRFVEKIGRFGIGEGVRVIAYDDQGGAMAARLWWMLDYLGHEEVHVLDGGYQGWKEKGYPVTAEEPEPTATTFTPQIRRRSQLADMEDVKYHRGTLIDSRDPDRFSGKTEPIDPKAGHIPGAINYFWKNNLADGQRWKSAEALKQDFAFLSDEEGPIIYCGSGVTACANLLALRLAGVSKARLYAGSWSDWITYEENPVRTGDGI
ncbi:sulfurtransferase [Paludifilum halophilum]|uniref:Sulfurtransferase n=1 Tax=Paludifilum halophilum TaxID=1642702 RepID=A0A235B1J4_9BACL|nr:sulfurtransferase [Paludifilum halophilum]OYD06180.1 sulfurtransferase [Paludifilum halophilum]